MTTATQAIEKVKNTGESRKSDQKRSPQMDVGDFARQGDVYIYRIKAVPQSATRVERPQLQLAPGATQGSRHCLDSLHGVEVFQLDQPNPLQGPLIVLAEQRTIEHPEHGHIALDPGIYAITYQRQHAEEVRRVED